MNKSLAVKFIDCFSGRMRNAADINIFRTSKFNNPEISCITVHGDTVIRANSCAASLFGGKINDRRLGELFDEVTSDRLQRCLNDIVNNPVQLLQGVSITPRTIADITLICQPQGALMLISPIHPEHKLDSRFARPHCQSDSEIQNAVYEMRTAISAATSALKLTETCPELKNDCNYSILCNLDRINRIAEGLLATPDSNCTSEATDAAFKICNACKSLRPYARNRAVTLAYDIPGEIPLIQLCADKLEGFAASLIANAVNITPEYGCVLVSLSSNENSLTLDVQSTCTDALAYPLAANRGALVAAQYARELGTAIHVDFSQRFGYSFKVELQRDVSICRNISQLA